MERTDYLKNIVVWTDDFTVQKVLVKIIKSLDFNPIVINSDKDFLKVDTFLIFTKGSFFNRELFEKKIIDLREGELTVAFIDETNSFGVNPQNFPKVDINQPSEIKNLITEKSNNSERYNKRRQAMKKKLNRLFYIYTLLKETGSVSSEQVLDKAKVSKRTFYRDIETIKDVCVNMDIYNSGNGTFWINK